MPCFNEEDAVASTTVQLATKLEALKAADLVTANSRIVLVDDGSSDATWQIVQQLAQKHEAVCGLRLQQNYGQQLALYAGMLEVASSCDAVITLDADGQHNLAAIDAMLAAFTAGNEIVYAVKQNPESDPPLKRLSASTYYKLLALFGAKTVKHHADYRLVSAQAIRYLARMPKARVFLRNDFPKLGLPSTTVPYICSPRAAGKSKYSLGKMFALACDGFASASSKQCDSTAIEFEIVDHA